MPDHDEQAEQEDELAALHAADPVDPADVPSPTRPEAVALFERITMADTETALHRQAPRAPRRRAMLAVAAAIAVVAFAGGAFALARDGDTDEANTPDQTSAPATSVPTTAGAITPGGPSSASCVETYDLTTLANREVVFDGTVTSVEGDDVTFAVNRWYTADGGGEVILRGASTLGGTTSVGDALSLEPGTRLLVAGDGGFAWSCGFTQPYDPTVAQQWAETFAG